MNIKKHVSIVLTIALTLVLMAGYIPSASAESAPLRVGFMPNPGGYLVAYALEKGYFEEYGLNIETMIFPTGAPINEAIAASEIDLAMSGAAAVFSLASDTCTLIAETATSGGMGIWVHPDSDILSVKGEASISKEMYGSAETIKGKSFFCGLGTTAEFNVLRYIAQYGLTREDVDLVQMDFAAAANAFNAGEGDAIATFAPYSTQVEDMGAVKACSFEDAIAIGTPLLDTVFVPNEVFNTRREELVNYLRAIHRAMDDLSDLNVRKEFSARWYPTQGREYDEATLDQELINRTYLDREYLAQNPNYALGRSMVVYGEFCIEVETLEPEAMEIIKSSLDSSLLSEALGIDIPMPD